MQKRTPRLPPHFGKGGRPFQGWLRVQRNWLDCLVAVLLDRPLGQWARGWCYACGRKNDTVVMHSTRYSDTSGTFPLCEECWFSMTPVDRLRYYAAKDGSDSDWGAIRAAVLAGK